MISVINYLQIHFLLVETSKKTAKTILLILFLLFIQKLNAQPWMDKIGKGNTNFYEIQKAFYDYYKEKKVKGDSVGNREEYDGEYTKFKRWEWFMEPRVYPSGDITLPSRNWEYFQNYINANPQLNQKYRTSTSFASQLFAGNWSFLGPSSQPINGDLGRVNFIKFDPHNSNIIWVGAPSGGLWKSINGGASWNTNTDLLTVIGCSDLVIDPNNSNIMYLATGDGNGGATFSIGVLKSTDGGLSWNPTALNWQVSLRYQIQKLLIHPTNSNIIFAATNVGLYKTSDAGVTWVQTQTGYFADIQFKPGTPTVVYAVTKGGYCLFYKSSNTGSSFINITSGLPASSEVNRYAIAITPSNPNYVYVIAVNTTNYGYYGIYRSTNSGSSFSVRSTTPDIITRQGWYNLSIAVNPFDANDIYVGGVYPYRSIDGGVTWSDIFGVHPDIHTLEFLPGSSTTIFSGNDGGIYKSSANGVAWSDISNGLAISQMYRIGASESNPNLYLTGLQDNGTNRFKDSEWQYIFGGDGMECIIDYSNPAIMYVSYQYGVILKSLDGGNNFTGIVNYGGNGVNAIGSWITPYVLNPANPSTLLVGKGQVYRSYDGGTNWSQLGVVSGGPYMRALNYAPSDSNFIYAAFSYNFFASIDGNTFMERTNNLPVSITNIRYIAISNTNPNKVWVTLAGYEPSEKIYMSNDGGVSWTNYSDGLPNLPANCIVYENGSNDRLYVGMDVGVYYRDNSMSSWQPYFEGLPNVIVNEMEIHYGTRKLRAATYGRGLWESDLIPNCTATLNTWTGTANTAWENPANWSCGIIPGPNTDVVINSGTIVLSSNVSVRSFTVNPAVNFTVSPGYNFTINH